MNIKIESDFTDFYDDMSDSNSPVIYKRYRDKSLYRGKALNTLKGIGVNTIQIKSVASFTDCDKLVVYTDVNGHDGTGKKICDFESAYRDYYNFAASRYYEGNTCYVKYLQIGKRRFRLIMCNDSTFGTGVLKDIVEFNSQYNYYLRRPIFSIDYISNNGVMLATDFNEVENLSRLGIDKYLTKGDIIKEVRDSIIEYKLNII